MSECIFSNHTDVKEPYRELVWCPLFAGHICKHHCLRIQGIFDRITELLRETINREQLINDPECLYEYLAGEVLDMVKEHQPNRNWNEARNSCLACIPVEAEPNPDIIPVQRSKSATNTAVLRRAKQFERK